MATTSQAPANGTDPKEHVLEVLVEYDETNDCVTVNPDHLHKETIVRFKNPDGHRLRIEFLSPSGDDCDVVTDSEIYRLKIGGTYHFRCYFTPPGGKEISPGNGGVIDVEPQRP